MAKINCSVCNYPLSAVDEDGIAHCENCGMQYTLAALQKLYQNSSTEEKPYIIKSNSKTERRISNLKEDIEELIMLGQFKKARKKAYAILKLSCDDEYAHEISSMISEYEKMQITDGVLEAYRGNAKKIKVPSNVKYLAEAFKYNKHIEEIILPGSIKEIYDNAFFDCACLKKITIPDCVSKIGEYAFYGCSSLEEIILPKNITEIHRYTFGKCISLKKISLPKGIVKIHNYAFTNCSNLNEVYLPAGVKEAGDGVFYECRRLREVIFREGLEFIGTHIFANCSLLERVTFPDTLKAVFDNTFVSCPRLEEVVLLNPYTKIYDSALYRCDSFDKFTFADYEKSDYSDEVSDIAETENIADIGKCKNAAIKYVLAGEFVYALRFVELLLEELPDNEGLKNVYELLDNLTSSELDENLKDDYIKAMVKTLEYIV